ncbi:MAG: hypothetical protein ACE5HX_19095 [bacterium]
MQKSRLFLTMFIGLLIFAMALFYLKVGWLLFGEVNHEAERMGYCFDVATDQRGSRLFVAAGHRGMHILKLLQGKLQ